MQQKLNTWQRGISLLLAGFMASPGLIAPVAMASSHMDAPLITRDPSANTTDVYAFVDEDGGQKKLVVALGVYPHQEPGIGPNKYNFDDNVLYEIHVALGKDVAAGRKTLSYRFEFNTEFKNKKTILQSYHGVEPGTALQAHGEDEGRRRQEQESRRRMAGGQCQEARREDDARWLAVQSPRGRQRSAA